jgi:hypothetical protein
MTQGCLRPSTGVKGSAFSLGIPPAVTQLACLTLYTVNGLTAF